MPQDGFDLECDRLSRSVDAALFERLRWERSEGPMLSHLVALAHSALERRSEFELIEEGATRNVKRFVLKIHGNRVLAITLRVDGGKAVVDAHSLDRSSHTLADGASVSEEFEAVDEAWMAGAMQALFSRANP